MTSWNAKNFLLWQGGPYWNSNLKLNQFVNVIMHVIYLGIIKSNRGLIKKWIGIVLKPNVFNISQKTVFLPI